MLPIAKRPLLEVGARYDIDYLGPNLTMLELEGARLTGTAFGTKDDEYEFETAKGRVVVLHPARILKAEPA